MKSNFLKEFLISAFVWITSIVVFFLALGNSTTGSIDGWWTFGVFVVGILSFLYALSKLALLVNNMSKLRLWSFLIWIITLIIFVIMIWDNNKVVEHRLFNASFWGGVGVGNIVLGVAAFVSLISSFGSIPKKTPLRDERESRSYAKTSLSSKISDELDDIIFIPKKKKGLGIGVVIVGAIVLGILTISVLGSGNNNVGKQASPTTITAKVSNLNIADPKITGNGRQSFTGIIRNSSGNLATDVIMRVDFAKDKDMKQNFDTRYFPIDYVAANGAFTFNIPFDMNYSGKYWWNAKVESAVFK
jgi:hypothetical protein